MKRTPSLLLLLVLGLATAFVGCDSGDTDPIDEDLVGTWNASTASVILNGLSVPVFTAGEAGELSITFSESTFTFVAAGPLEIDPPIGASIEILAAGEGSTISGTYVFTSGDGVVTFTPTVVNDQPISDQVMAPVPITFQDENTVVLRVENTAEGRALLAFLLGDRVPEEIRNAIDGGSITFRRAY